MRRAARQAVRSPRFWIHAVLYVALFGGLLFGGWRLLEAIDTQRQGSIHVCERLRIVRANERVEAPPADRARVDGLMPLVDCEQAFDDGNGTLLSPEATAEFLRRVERGESPVVRDGRVVAP
ncbi:MAG: hypothetical protein M3340_12070 [Actinomycetota bacterium]|nr:hypothetical protein [Actinomycetota bacterium]